MTRLNKMARFLVYGYLVAFLAGIFVLPAYRQMHGGPAWQDHLRMLIWLVASFASYFITKGWRLSGTAAIGFTSSISFVLKFITWRYDSAGGVMVAIATSFWDFFALMFLYAMQKGAEKR